MQYYTISINGSNLHYVEYPGERETIIAIHGLTGNHKQLHYFANALKGKYRIIAIDLKGRGESNPVHDVTSIHTHTQDVMALITELKIENPIIMGYSLGAFIAANVASKLQNVKGIILLDGAATSEEHQKRIIEPSLGRLGKQYSSPEDYIEGIRGIYDLLGVKWTDHLEEVGRFEIKEVEGSWRGKTNELTIREDIASVYDYQPKEVFSAVNCPILLVHSTGNIGPAPALFLAEHYRDTLVYAKNIHKITSDTNHYTLVFEERTELNREIGRFIGNLI